MAGTNLVVQPRDRRLFAHLTRVSVIDREQAMQLAPFHSIARANARLLALVNAGYLRHCFVGTINGGRKAVYFHPGRRRVKPGLIAHELAVAEVYCAFRGSGWSAPAAPLTSGGIIPDGLVACSSGPMFIEVDRGTESLGVFGKKVEGYLAHALSDTAKRFRVLVVTSSERRLQNLSRTIAHRTGRLFFLTTFSTLKTFGPWAPIWRRPGREGITLLLCDTAEAAAASAPAAPGSAAGAANHSTGNSAPSFTPTRAGP